MGDRWKEIFEDDLNKRHRRLETRLANAWILAVVGIVLLVGNFFESTGRYSGTLMLVAAVSIVGGIAWALQIRADKDRVYQELEAMRRERPGQR